MCDVNCLYSLSTAVFILLLCIICGSVLCSVVIFQKQKHSKIDGSRVTRGNYFICGGVSNLRVGSINSRSRRPANERVNQVVRNAIRKTRLINRSIETLIQRYITDRQMTRVRTVIQNVPACMDYFQTSGSTYSDVFSDFNALNTVLGVLTAMQQDETNEYAERFENIKLQVRNLMCELYILMRIYGEHAPPRNITSPEVTICPFSTSAESYERNMLLLTRIQILTETFSRKYVRIRRNQMANLRLILFRIQKL